MTQLFITSDEHIGHANIIDLANRPFTSLDEMKHTVITNHNKKVPNSRGVLTVHVGDWLWHSLTFEEGMEYISQLNGRHAFMFGNHDEWIEKHRYQLISPNLPYGKLDFIVGENKAGGAKIFNCDKMHVTADHFARRVWQGSHKGHGHVYGHSHSALPGLGRSFDIGVDGNNFTPWAIEEIVAKLRTIQPHHTINNTGEGMTEDVVNEGRGSSMGEHRTCNRQVAGSSPVPGSTVHSPGCVCGFCKMGSTSWT